MSTVFHGNFVLSVILFALHIVESLYTTLQKTFSSAFGGEVCHSTPDFGGLSLEAWISGDTPDISCLYVFAWYEWVWFIDPNLPDKDKRRLGRWLGPSYDVGEEMCSFIFTDEAKVITRTSVWPLSVEDNNSDPVKQLKESFESGVKSILKDRAELIDKEDDPATDSTTPIYERYAYSVDDATVANQAKESENLEVAKYPTAEAFNNWIGSQVYLPRGDRMQHDRVTGSKCNASGNYVGHCNQNTAVLDEDIDHWKDGTTDVGAQVLKKQYQFGIYAPSTVAEALEIDRQNGNTLWADAIKKETENVKPVLSSGYSEHHSLEVSSVH